MIVCTLTYFNHDLYRQLSEGTMAKPANYTDKTYTEREMEYGRPGEDGSSRFSQDALLRKYGYRIHSRRKGAEAVWSKNGALYTHSHALSLLPKHEVQDADYAEALVLEEDDE